MLWHSKNLGNPGGRWVLCLGNPDGRGGGDQRSLEIQVGGGSKSVAIRGGGGWIFSGITHSENGKVTLY